MIDREDEVTQVTRLLDQLGTQVQECRADDRRSVQHARAVRRRISSRPKLAAVQPFNPTAKLHALAGRAEELMAEILTLTDARSNGPQR